MLHKETQIVSPMTILQLLHRTSTLFNIHNGNNNKSYDSRPNGWGRKLQKHTTGIFKLFTHKNDSISPPRGQIQNIKLAPAIQELTTFAAEALAGQEPFIYFKIQG